MKKSHYSSNLQALLPMENYQLILNEKTRLNKFIHSQNIIKINKLDPEQTTRRKSCHCSQCGQQSHLQFKTMNIPLKTREIKKVEANVLPELIVTKPDCIETKYFLSQNEYILQKVFIQEFVNVRTQRQCNYRQFTFIIENNEIYQAVDYNLQNLVQHLIVFKYSWIQKSIQQIKYIIKIDNRWLRKSKRRESSGLFSSSDLQSLNSLKSLNITTSPTQSFLNHKNSIQLKTPISLFSPKRPPNQTHKKLLSSNIKKINYNPYIIYSNKQLLIKPLKLQTSLSTHGSSLPKLTQKKS